MVCDYIVTLFIFFVPVLIICREKWFICSLLRDAASFSSVKDFPNADGALAICIT